MRELYENDKNLKNKPYFFIKYKFNKQPTNNLNQCYSYIVNFLLSLRNDQELMFKIIQKASKDDSKKCLSSLLINNFYENILSSNYIEVELLAIIERSLKYEIDKLKNSNQPQHFLNDTVLGIIFEGLINKIDIKSYFNMIFNGIIDKMENKTNDSLPWNFKVSSINQLINCISKENKNQIINNKNNLNESNSYESSSIDLSINNKSIEKEEESFLYKYIPDLNKKELINFIQKEENENIKQFIINQLTELVNDELIYSNTNFLNEVYSYNDPSTILNYYQKDFKSCIDIIKEIFNILNENIHLIPFSVKCICKIISILIKKKFKNITQIELNAFIGQFFFGKLFLPVFQNVDYSTLITSFIISKRTKINISHLCIIINKLVSGKFFTQKEYSCYTPFNLFFILDILPSCLEFFNKIINVTLPSYIEKLINEPEKDNFYYDYFNENKNEIILHQSICFSINDFYTLFSIVEKNKDFFLQEPTVNGLDEKIINQKLNERKIFKLTLQKLEIKTHSETIINHLNVELNIKTRNFYLKHNTFYNEEFSKLMKINEKNTQPNFSIPEIKNLKTDDDVLKNNIIKIQNCISKILYNYRNLNKIDFSEGTTINSINIFNELLKFLKIRSFVINNSIPTKWYIYSLLKLLKTIPKEYKENDYEIIYTILINNLKESIKNLDFEKLSQISEKLKCTESSLQNLSMNLFAINDLETNNLIKHFVENFPLEVEIKYSVKRKKFQIEKSNYGISNENQDLNDFFFQEKKKKKRIICNTIIDFINKFPPLIYYQEKQGLNLFELENEFNLPLKLENYFNLIKDAILRYKFFSEIKNKNIIYFKITSYIMSKIYDKIFPRDPEFEDIKIYHNSVRLSWIEPSDLIGNNNYNFDNFLPETKELLDKIENEKTPLGKINYFNDLYNKTKNIIQFNNENGKLFGIDDLLPIFQYAIIKAQPSRLYSNFKYINMYMNKEFKNGQYDHLVSQINVIGEFIKNVSYENFNGITQEQFIKKCNDAIINDMPSK